MPGADIKFIVRTRIEKMKYSRLGEMMAEQPTATFNRHRPHRELLLTDIPRMIPRPREYSRFSGLPARQKRGADGYRHLGQPERWSRG